jgi:SMP-30/gluconolaconase/LRE-like protein
MILQHWRDAAGIRRRHQKSSRRVAIAPEIDRKSSGSMGDPDLRFFAEACHRKIGLRFCVAGEAHQSKSSGANRRTHDTAHLFGTEDQMKTWLTRCMFALLIAIGAPTGTAWANDDSDGDRNAAKQFATLPDGVRFPEGITANPATREIYVGTFDFGPNSNKLLRFAPNGHLVAQKDFGAQPLLGLAFAGGKVYIANVGARQIQRISAAFNSAMAPEVVATVPLIGPPADRKENNPDGSMDTIIFGATGAAPNGLVFDKQGRLYVSDSFQGAIFRIDNPSACAPSCPMTTVSHDPRLATAGFPPFGANGLALNSDDSALFIANTGDDRVLKLDIASNALTVFAESINGADGLAFDSRGRLWVAANQNDEVVALNEKGRVIARLGDFEGIRHDGSPDGLLFPASIVIVGDDMFVTNLALPLTGAVGDEPEEDVTRWTVSRIKVPRRP